MCLVTLFMVDGNGQQSSFFAQRIFFAQDLDINVIINVDMRRNILPGLH